MCIAACIYQSVELIVKIRGSFEQWGNIASVAKSAALNEKMEKRNLYYNIQKIQDSVHQSGQSLGG